MDQEMNNMPNNEPAGAPQVAPEQVVTEQVTVAEAGPVVLEPEKPKKKSNGMLLGLILCLLLAAGGIGFGVWAMMDGNTQKENSEKQISDLKAQNSKLSEQVAALQEENSDNGKDKADYSGGPYIENGYFYVPEWRLKFQIPDELTNYGYSVDYALAAGDGNMDTVSPKIGFTAMLKSDIVNEAQDWTYDTIETCAIVSVSKEKAGWNKNDINGIIKSFDDYTLLIWNYSRHSSCDHNLHIDEIQEKIQAMFSNPESY